VFLKILLREKEKNNESIQQKNAVWFTWSVHGLVLYRAVGG
jgi:hypothetical protein